MSLALLPSIVRWRTAAGAAALLSSCHFGGDGCKSLLGRRQFQRRGRRGHASLPRLRPAGLVLAGVAAEQRHKLLAGRLGEPAEVAVKLHGGHDRRRRRGRGQIPPRSRSWRSAATSAVKASNSSTRSAFVTVEVLRRSGPGGTPRPGWSSSPLFGVRPGVSQSWGSLAGRRPSGGRGGPLQAPLPPDGWRTIGRRLLMAVSRSPNGVTPSPLLTCGGSPELGGVQCRTGPGSRTA